MHGLVGVEGVDGVVADVVGFVDGGRVGVPVVVGEGFVFGDVEVEHEAGCWGGCCGWRRWFGC